MGFKKWFKKLFKKEEHARKKFIECTDLEDFRRMYMFCVKQDIALENGYSYLEVTTSNVDGHISGEMFDNMIRIKFLEEDYPDYLAELGGPKKCHEIAEAEFEEDMKNLPMILSDTTDD